MGLRDLVNSAPALQEFGVVARVILPVMKDATISRSAKRKTLSDAVDSLSEKTFSNSIVVSQIMTIINMKEDVCKEYKDTEAQVNGILSWIPRMKQHRDVLKKEVAKHRKQYGLKL